MCVCVLLHRGDVVNQSRGSQRTLGEQGSAVRKAKFALLLESCLAFFMAHPRRFTGNKHISELQPDAATAAMWCSGRARSSPHLLVLQ